MQQNGTCGSHADAIGLRKLVIYREAVVTEAGATPARPALQASVAAVLRNPWVGTGPTHDLSAETSRDRAGAGQVAHRPADRRPRRSRTPSRRSARPPSWEARGEIEHGGALIHTPYFGNLMREFLDGESIICFADTRAEAGETLVVPLWHKTQAATRSHYQTVTTRVSDAPARRRDRHRRRRLHRPPPASPHRGPHDRSRRHRRRIWRVSCHEGPQDRHHRRGDPHRRRPGGQPAGARGRRRGRHREPLGRAGFRRRPVRRASTPPHPIWAPCSHRGYSTHSDEPAEAYGKAAIVGLDGEIEHGSGLIHTLKFGDHFRKAANATTLLPAVEKRGPAGSRRSTSRSSTSPTPPSGRITRRSRCASPTHRTPTRSSIALAAAAQGRPQQRLAPLSTEQ